MEQNKVPVSKKYTLDNDFAEMRFKYSKLKSEKDIKSKVRTGWNMFQCANSLAELINQRLNPFDVVGQKKLIKRRTDMSLILGNSIRV